MRFFAAVLAALPVVLGITILQPSPTSYWVEMTTNEIVWSYNAGDPSPITVVVTAQNDTTLNGVFTIAQSVDLALETYTITNVTLVVGSGYAVSFVNPTNESDVYTTSQSFSVMAPGTSAAPSSAVPSSASGSASGSRASSTSPSTSSSGNPSSTHSSAAARAFGISAQGMYGTLAACGVAAVSALLL
ncbi:predicted protein [Sparassis crispa]|uniref:Yeast cell wall synthesis Kre9/Knh1-like N-terminal domain-containing protein n=1 Tax=Sparassis crispa TaxID=139825 RepID=A0A401GYG6_9APHY|nr:predicted protein [Sparassis crispa]GBE86894.1 predicted protein [Sparassis crispa]